MATKYEEESKILSDAISLLSQSIDDLESRLSFAVRLPQNAPVDAEDRNIEAIVDQSPLAHDLGVYRHRIEMLTQGIHVIIGRIDL